MKKWKIILYRPDGGVEMTYNNATEVRLPTESYRYLSFAADSGKEVVTNLGFVVREQ